MAQNTEIYDASQPSCSQKEEVDHSEAKTGQKFLANGAKSSQISPEALFKPYEDNSSRNRKGTGSFQQNLVDILTWRQLQLRRTLTHPKKESKPSNFGTKPKQKLFSVLSEPPDATELSILRNKLSFCKSLYHRNLSAHSGCVNAVEFSPKDERFLASGGDDRRVFIWRTADVFGSEAIRPMSQMRVLHDSNIFCLAFSEDASKIFSSGNDHQVIMHNVDTCEPAEVWNLQDAVYSLSVNPGDEKIFATASEDGYVKIFDMRIPSNEDPFILARNAAPFQTALYNPCESRVIATANARDGAQLWDVRKPLCHTMQFYNNKSDLSTRRSAMSVRWNNRGNRLMTLRRKMMPAVYELTSQYPVGNFDDLGYHNSCTMKTCTFGGPDDSLIMSGSDDFNVYIWKVRKSVSPVKPLMVLKGHRSIVNQVRYSHVNHFIVTSGVEKIIKVWSPWNMPKKMGYLEQETTPSRPMYTHEEYIGMVLRGGGMVRQEPPTSNDVDEDPKMLAFFDSLVQREIEDWNESEDSGSSSDDVELHFGPHRKGSSFSHPAYSREVVDSETSSDASGAEGNVARGAGARRGSEPQNAENSSSEGDVDLDRYGGRFSPFSVAYAQYLRRQHNSDREGGEQASGDAGGLDPNLGYLPNQPEAVRNATELVIKKRQEIELEESRKARRRGRFLSESGMRPGTRGGKKMTADDVKKRLGLAAKRRSALTVRQRRLKRMRRMVMRDLADGSSSEEDASGSVRPVMRKEQESSRTDPDPDSKRKNQDEGSVENEPGTSTGSVATSEHNDHEEEGEALESYRKRKSDEKLFRKKKRPGKIRRRSSQDETE